MTVLRFSRAVMCCCVSKGPIQTAPPIFVLHRPAIPKIGIQKLVALIPKPRSHLVRYHGVFTPNARLRKEVVAKAPKSKRGEGSELAKGCTKKRMAWHRLMRRVFEIDVLQCPKCKGRMTNVSFIIQRTVIRKILKHLGLPGDSPKLSPPKFKQMDFDYA